MTNYCPCKSVEWCGPADFVSDHCGEAAPSLAGPRLSLSITQARTGLIAGNICMSSTTETSPGPSAMPPAAEEAPGAGGGRALWRAADRREAALLGHHSGPEEQGSPEQRGLSPMAPGDLGRVKVQGLLVADASSHAANGWRDGARMCRRPCWETPGGRGQKAALTGIKSELEEVDAGREQRAFCTGGSTGLV